MVKGTVVRRDGRLYVQHTDNLWSQPVQVIQYWPIEERLSRAASRLEGFTVVDHMGRGEFQLEYGAALERLGDTMEYHQLKECKAVLPHGGRTQSEFREEIPIPCPRVRKGIETRYECGRWEKLLRKGWVPA